MMTVKVTLFRGLLLVLSVTGAVLSGSLLFVHASMGTGGQGTTIAVLEPQPKTTGAILQELTFPYCLGNDIWIEMVTGYEGLYTEDESMEPIVDGAAILLYNGGEKMLEDVEVTLVTDEDDLVFSGTYLPPGNGL